MHMKARDFVTILMSLVCFLLMRLVEADIIMMDGRGMPSIMENDEFEKDFILMPGMSTMMFNDDLVL